MTQTLDPEFYRMYEFPVTIPGESQLQIKVADYDRFGYVRCATIRARICTV